MSLLANIGISHFTDLYLADNPALKYFYGQMYRNFNPDITGYTLLFMIPPEFSSPSFANLLASNKTISNTISSLLSTVGMSPQVVNSVNDFAKVYPFMATEYTPPQTQVQNAQIQTRSGALSYASDVHSTETISVSFLESSPLTIYKFHLLWVEYIRELLKGNIEPDKKYLEESTNDDPLSYYGAQDYLASLYIVKYIPDMKTITYIAKCVGVYPLSLPSKELIGTRSANDICILPFEYSCIAFREYVDGLNINKWIFNELSDVLQAGYSSSILNSITGLISGAVSDIGSAVGTVVSNVSSTISSTIGSAGNAFSETLSESVDTYIRH